MSYSSLKPLNFPFHRLQLPMDVSTGFCLASDSAPEPDGFFQNELKEIFLSRKKAAEAILYSNIPNLKNWVLWPKGKTINMTNDNKKDIFWPGAILLSIPLVLLVSLSLGKMLVQPRLTDLISTLYDKEVLAALGRSMFTAISATLIVIIFGTPLAYILARKNFPGKKIIEGFVDLPIMIPHPVIGIAILTLFGGNFFLGKFLAKLGIEIMGTLTGIIIVLVFVGCPFYINTVKAGFEEIPLKLEKASRSLGASMTSTFFRVTFPLVWRSMILGAVMCTARAISEFGAVIIVAYNPMTAPVLIYERFTAYGLKYSQTIAFWLIIISFILFIAMRCFAREKKII